MPFLRYQHHNFNINNRIQYWKIRKRLAKNREKTFFSKLKLDQKSQFLFFFFFSEGDITGLSKKLKKDGQGITKPKKGHF